METIKDSYLFTPRTKSGERLAMHISYNDIIKIERGHKWSAEITDMDTNKRYKVRGAPCNLPHCFCDAVIVRETTLSQK